MFNGRLGMERHELNRRVSCEHGRYIVRLVLQEEIQLFCNRAWQRIYWSFDDMIAGHDASYFTELLSSNMNNKYASL